MEKFPCIFCIDIGNTHTHYGVWSDGSVNHCGTVKTAKEKTDDCSIVACWEKASQATAYTLPISFCSVVPAATAILKEKIEGKTFVYHLTHATVPSISINYPKPSEVGQDRLANAIAGKHLLSYPCVIIDMGTAVTFDIVDKDGAYAGGIIAPGLAIMTRYLHEQTALLPALNPDELSLSNPSMIGKSTIEAMKLGCAIGFSGMIRSLLEATLDNLSKTTEKPIPVIATGGSAGALLKTYFPNMNFDPDLTLKGLAIALRENT